MVAWQAANVIDVQDIEQSSLMAKQSVGRSGGSWRLFLCILTLDSAILSQYSNKGVDVKSYSWVVY